MYYNNNKSNFTITRYKYLPDAEKQKMTKHQGKRTSSLEQKGPFVTPLLLLLPTILTFDVLLRGLCLCVYHASNIFI